LVSFVRYQEAYVSIGLGSNQMPLKILLKPSENLLNQTVVSAGRFEQSVKRMVVSTEVIQPYLIQNRNTTMMDKLLDQVPSVNIIDGQINIRNGSGWTYGAGSRVMLLVDDMPFLTGDAAQVKWNFVPIENVKQVEVVKGASSVLYGSSALSGIVHLRTEMATDKPITRISAFTGVFSKPTRAGLIWNNDPKLQNGFSLFHSAKKNHFTYAVSANYFKDNGYRQGESDHRFRLNTNLKWQAKNKVQYGLNLGALFSDGGSFLLWDSLERGYNILGGQITTTKSSNFYADPHVSFYTGAFKHNVRGRFMYISNDIINSDPTINQDNSSRNTYVEYQVQRFISSLNLVITGGFANSLNYSNSPLYQGVQSSRNHAGFIQLDQTIAKKITLNAGARWEYFKMNQTEESKPVFRAGANYELAKASFLRASFGQGYRFPSIAERYIQTSVGLLNIFPNPNLGSETGWNAEIGLKQGFSLGKVKGFVDVAYFHTQYQNMIDFNLGMWRRIDDPFNPLKSYGFTSLNIGDTKITGLDLSVNATGNIGKLKLQTILGYTYTNPVMLDNDKVFATDSLGISYSFRSTRSDSSNVLKYRFKHLFKWDVQLEYFKWQFGYSVRYNSFMENVDAAFVSAPLSLFVRGVSDARNANRNGNTVMDIRVAYSVNAKFKVALIINNLLNAEIMTRPADIRPPRLSIIQLNYSF
ncbi:MAG: TonB-dependent receptor, partial [Bacteroidia bacterium]|nr:TonB-dependent receptor [Bacteroidia bacterium]